MINKKRAFWCILGAVPMALLAIITVSFVGVGWFYPVTIGFLIIYEFITLPWVIGAKPLWKENRWKK